MYWLTALHLFYLTRLSRLAAAAGIGVQLDKHGVESYLWPFKTPEGCGSPSSQNQTLRAQEGVSAQFMACHHRAVVCFATVCGARRRHRSKSCSAVYMMKDLRYRGLSTPLSVPLFFEAVQVQHSV
ncbi:hypothetical protein B0H11DRAFT_1122269 [Mycena galericulata]|nr:hypothetical protein B0H11DRAFT_1122269 [Mycena galericulata]